MDIAVCIKQTVDTEAEVGVDAEGRALTEGQTLVIDPYSEFAVERAVQLAEEHGGDVSVVCVGGDEAVPAVRHALSMGASAGYLVDDAAPAVSADLQPPSTRSAAALERVPADLVLGCCKSAGTAGRAVPTSAASSARPPCRNCAACRACRWSRRSTSTLRRASRTPPARSTTGWPWWTLHCRP